MPRLALLLALVGFAFPAAAQSDYGSVYSRFALGQRFESGTSQSDAMGGAGLAIRSGFYTGADNPALSADLSLATFSASGLVRGVEATDATDSTSVSTAGGLGSLQLALPLYAGKLGLALSYQPYTRVDYRAAREGTVELDGGTEQAYRSNLEGNGGLQQISLGLGGKISESLTVGASADALVGTVEYLKRTEFPDALSSFTEVREAESTRLYGFTGTVGATFSLLDLAREGDGLTLAGAVTLPTTLHGSRAFTLGSSLDRDTLATQEDGTATLPLTARAGIAYRSGPRFLAAVDASYEPWSEFESDFAFGGYDPAGNDDQATLSDRLRVGGGVEWTPAGGRRGAPYVQLVSYRLGAYMEDGLVSIDGQELLTRALTGGISLPTRFSNARLDLGFEIGTRGETTGVLVEDLFWRGTLTLNFGERWFVRRRIG